MPQIFQVLRCYKCCIFQVHQTKKSNKWQCKLCGEKQSIKRHYGIGTAKDCRLHVQKLNSIRGEIDELSENSQNDTDVEGKYNEPATTVNDNPLKKSRWSDYVDDKERDENQLDDKVMYLGNAEVVLDSKIKKRQFKSNSFKVPKKYKNHEEEISKIQNESNVCKEIFETLTENSKVEQNSFVRGNYNMTRNDYKSTMIKRQNNNNGSLKPTTISMIMKKPNLETQKSQSPVEFVSPVVNRNSKWANYINTEEDSKEEHNDILNHHCNDNKNQSFFSLCDDKDLDDVLDI